MSQKSDILNTVSPAISHLNNNKNEKNEKRVIVAGHICLDLVPAFEPDGQTDFSEMFVPGRLIQVGESVLSSGGAVSNTGIALRQLGVPAQLMAKIGDDLFGRGLTEILEPYKEGLELIVDGKTSTSYSYVIAPPGVDRFFIHNPGANSTFCAADLDFDLISRTDLFHFGYPSLMRRLYLDNGAEFTALMRKVKEKGVTTSLDLALPDPESESGRLDWEQILSAALPFTDFFFPSIEEILFMLDRPLFDAITAEMNATGAGFIDIYDMHNLAELSAKILGMGCAVVVIKLGKKGLYMRTSDAERLAAAGRGAPDDPASWANRQIFAPSYFVAKIESTSGAGDASIAGVLAGILHGQSPEKSLQLGCAVAAQKIQVRKSFGGITPLADVLSLLSSWKQECVIGIPSDWVYDEAGKIWRT